MDPAAVLAAELNLAALVSAAALLLGAYLFMEWMITLFVKTNDVARGRDRCCYCGHALIATEDGVGYETVCRGCERTQPWFEERP